MSLLTKYTVIVLNKSILNMKYLFQMVIKYLKEIQVAKFGSSLAAL